MSDAESLNKTAKPTVLSCKVTQLTKADFLRASDAKGNNMATQLALLVEGFAAGRLADPSDYQSLLAKYEEEKAERERLMNLESKLKHERQTVEEEKESLSKQVKDLQSEKGKLSKQVKDLNSKLEKAENEKGQMSDQTKKRIEELEKNLTQTEKELEQWKKTAKERQNTIKSYQMKPDPNQLRNKINKWLDENTGGLIGPEHPGYF